MSYTLANIISEVQSKINDPSFSSSDIIQYANNSNREIHNSYQLRYMQATQDYTTTASQDTIGSLPTNFQSGYNLRCIDKSYAGKLTHLPFDEFDTMFPQPTLQAPSIPTYWYTFSNTIHVFPAPSTPSGITQSPGVYTLELRYLKTPTNLAATTDVPDVPEDFRQLITLGCLKQAMEKRSRFDVAQEYDQQYQTMLVSFLDRYGIGGFAQSEAYVIPDPMSSRY